MQIVFVMKSNNSHIVQEGDPHPPRQCCRVEAVSYSVPDAACRGTCATFYETFYGLI